MAPGGAVPAKLWPTTETRLPVQNNRTTDILAEALDSLVHTTLSPTALQESTVMTSGNTLPPPVPEQSAAVFIYGFCLVLIPTATILGNLLVIISVLRFKALHSAINFLILGLAVADLFVALFVMPYAVYVYIQGGYWFLGPLMCDIYLASDVACSTASIFLLAVISFDRYRAVSRPIQYSRQSQNIKRVVVILIVIWVVSLALASPMVLGLNYRPVDASPYECLFYNAEFSIGSSIVSFIVPCIIVLFVYIRIMMALRKREKAAKMRRLANQAETKPGELSNDDVDAGHIVTAPAVNVLMLALPSMQRRMRRFERHRNALQEAGELFKVHAWARPIVPRRRRSNNPPAASPNRRPSHSPSVVGGVTAANLSSPRDASARQSARQSIISSQSALIQMAEMTTNAVGVATLDPEAAVTEHALRRCRFAEVDRVKEYEVDDYIDTIEEEEEVDEEDEEEDESDTDESLDNFHTSARNLFAKMGSGVANMSRLTDAAISVIGARPRLSLAEPTLRRLLPPSRRSPNTPDSPTKRKNGLSDYGIQTVASPQTLGLHSLMPLLATGSLRRSSDSVSQMRTSSCRMPTHLSPTSLEASKSALRPASVSPHPPQSPLTPRPSPVSCSPRLSPSSPSPPNPSPVSSITLTDRPVVTEYTLSGPYDDSLQTETNVFTSDELVNVPRPSQIFGNCEVSISEKQLAEENVSVIIYPLKHDSSKSTELTEVGSYYDVEAKEQQVIQLTNDNFASTSNETAMDTPSSLADTSVDKINDSGMELSARSAQKHREAIWEARMKFFHSGPQPKLHSRSPLMLRRFVCDPENDYSNMNTPEGETKSSTWPKRRQRESNEQELGNSSSPLSSSDELSENCNVVTNDFISEAPTSMSRKSSEYESYTNGGHLETYQEETIRKPQRQNSVLRNPMKRLKSLNMNNRTIPLPNVPRATELWRQFSRRSPRIFRPVATSPRRLTQKKFSYAEESLFGQTAPLLETTRRKSDSATNVHGVRNEGAQSSEWVVKEESVEEVQPIEHFRFDVIEETVPKSSTSRFEGALTSADLGEDMDYVDVDSLSRSHDDHLKLFFANVHTQTIPLDEECDITATLIIEEDHNSSDKPTAPISLNIMAVSSEETSAANDATIATDSGVGADLTPKEGMKEKVSRKVSKTRSKTEESGSPTVTFKIPGKMNDKQRHSREDRPMKRLFSAAQIYENKRAISKSDSKDEGIIRHTRSFSQRLRGSLGAVVGPTNSKSEHSMDSCYSSSQSQGTNTTTGANNSNNSKSESKKGRLLSNPRLNGSTTELAVRMVKKAINRKESSLKRKVNKAQRKEKRATKTLGIVVGIFLVCWVPFFGINILNAICVKLDAPNCQVGFGPFFYATWIGYMNSFMNPVIYTIFNTEFRRAFKSLLLGKSGGRRQRARHV